MVWTLNLLLYLLDDDDDDNDDDGMLSSPALFSLCMQKKVFAIFQALHIYFIFSPIFFGEPLKQTAHPAALSCYTCQLHMSNHPALLLLMTSLWYLLVGSPHSTPLLSAVLSALSPHSTLSASQFISTLAHWLLVTLHLHSPYYTLTSRLPVSPSFLCQLTSVSSPAVFTLLSLVF